MGAVDWLICGLGNPGAAYRWTRHNLGFLVLDKLAREMAIGMGPDDDLLSEVGAGSRGGRRLLLARPRTWMNRSGIAVHRLCGHAGLGDDAGRLIVVHDDLDIPCGFLKIKLGGGHGGHNGVRSIIAELGTGDFHRVRVGIAPAERPDDVVAYVLSPFPSAAVETVDRVVEQAAAAVLVMIDEDTGTAMQQFHGRRL
ncbi:MAG: aminoacyl-tRNA hydrolase [Deltaproteobacteria bacterium]|nr:aminoacyl-tRNA hydrolase [Candidatus Anaeroferrophillacea bacterium]